MPTGSRMSVRFFGGWDFVSEDADNDRDDVWEKFPSVRRILSKWGMIDENSDRSAVTALGIQVEKVLIRGTQHKFYHYGYRRYQWVVGYHPRQHHRASDPRSEMPRAGDALLRLAIPLEQLATQEPLTNFFE